jgi:hypothetical protein
MRTYTIKKFNTDQKTPIQPSTIPNFWGQFQKLAGFRKICVSIRKIKGSSGIVYPVLDFLGRVDSSA